MLDHGFKNSADDSDRHMLTICRGFVEGGWQEATSFQGIELDNRHKTGVRDPVHAVRLNFWGTSRRL